MFGLVLSVISEQELDWELLPVGILHIICHLL